MLGFRNDYSETCVLWTPLGIISKCVDYANVLMFKCPDGQFFTVFYLQMNQD